MTTQDTHENSGTYAETVAQFVAAHRKAENAEIGTGRKMVDAGLALIVALERGAITFDRITGAEATAVRATGVMLKGDVAKTYGISPTMLTKYVTTGLAACAGVVPGSVDKSDWLLLTRNAAAKWMTEAVATVDGDTIRKALADHRPGAKPAGIGAEGKATSKKKAAPKDAKVTPDKVTARTVEADVMRVTSWLTTHPGAVKGESRDTIIALLREAADAVEATAHKVAASNETPLAVAV